ncbi:NAD(P)H-binding protein [Vibrio olivae]|uniref:NAD(P)H-binding protein n=1 Tax=Vibrio olivae TaxID=1243002 RepID=A0ABV5HL71_9VIBR
MKILILGSAGRISRLLIQRLLNETDHQLVLLARNANSRLRHFHSNRVKLVDGDFTNRELLACAMNGVDAIYLNSMGKAKESEIIRDTMLANNIKRIIGATILGIYNEVKGPFGDWNKRMVGVNRIQAQADSVAVYEESSLDYTMLRLTWLYDAVETTKYDTTHKGEDFKGTEVSREGVVQLIIDILNDQTGRFNRTSLGVGEADKDGDCPSFY